MRALWRKLVKILGLLWVGVVRIEVIFALIYYAVHVIRDIRG